MLQAFLSAIRIFNLVSVAMSSVAAIIMLLRNRPQHYRPQYYRG